MYKSSYHHKKNDDIPLNHSIPPMYFKVGSWEATDYYNKKAEPKSSLFPKIYFKYIVFIIIIPNHRKMSIGKYANILGGEIEKA